MKYLDLAILTACLVGLACSALLIGLGIAAFPLHLQGFSETFAKYQFFAIFLTMTAFIFRIQSLTKDLTQKEFLKNLYTGCPLWMKRITYAAIGIGAVLFFLPAFFELVGNIPHSEASTFPSTLPGGFGLIVFSSMFSQLIALRARLAL